MASTLVEQARVGHEEMEMGVKKLTKLLGMETKTHKQKLMQQHQARTPRLSARPPFRGSFPAGRGIFHRAPCREG